MFNSTFFVLDFDRTLGNTEKFHDVLEQVIKEEVATITIGSLRAARARAEAAGKSFDTIDYVRQFLTQSTTTTWQDVLQAFIRQAKTQDMLLPHAAELLRLLDEKKIPYGIITYGGEAWQLAKIEAANLLAVPHLVTHIEEKSRILAGWKHHDNESFVIPPALTRDFRPLTVDMIVFLDDKAKSFHLIPAGVKGIHVHSATQPPLPSQQGVLPPDVTSVAGLDGAIKLLFNN